MALHRFPVLFARMVADSYSETVTVGYLTRLQEAAMNVPLGFGLILFSILILRWNEKNAHRKKLAVDAIGKSVVSVPDLLKENDGKRVHFIGKLGTTDPVTDKVLAPAGGDAAKPVLRLRRAAEMFAWGESKKQTTKDKLGGKKEVTTTYSYSTGWSGGPQDSSSFKKPGANKSHYNPPMQIKSASESTTSATIGPFEVRRDLGGPPGGVGGA